MWRRHIHVLDEAHLGTDPLAVLHQLDQLIVVGATNDDGIQLDAVEAGRDGGLDPGEDGAVRVDAGQLSKAVGPQRVEADGDAVEPRVPKRSCLLGEEDTVGSERQIADRVLSCQQPHERRHVSPEERLTAGEPQLVDAQTGEDIDQRAHLFKGEDVLAGQPDVVFFRHAVRAAEITPVRD